LSSITLSIYILKESSLDGIHLFHSSINSIMPPLIIVSNLRTCTLLFIISSVYHLSYQLLRLHSYHLVMFLSYHYVYGSSRTDCDQNTIRNYFCSAIHSRICSFGTKSEIHVDSHFFSVIQSYLPSKNLSILVQFIILEGQSFCANQL